MAALDPRHNSRQLVEGPARAAARAQLKGIGFDDEALSKPIIGVASTWIETMPCNYQLRALAAKGKEGIREAGGGGGPRGGGGPPVGFNHNRVRGGNHGGQGRPAREPRLPRGDRGLDRAR